MDVSPEPPLRLADSPWFWGLLFSVMALVGIGLIGPKYARRQAQVEGRFLGRQRAEIERQRRAAGLAPVDLAETAAPIEEAPPERIVPLWTLVGVAGVAALGSATMLWRERRRTGGGERLEDPPAGRRPPAHTDHT